MSGTKRALNGCIINKRISIYVISIMKATSNMDKNLICEYRYDW
jgi:hypothetical protein